MALFIVIISWTLAAAGGEINFNDYKDFQKRWKLVTVRYRKDTGEQRFVYANSIVWEDFKKKNKLFSQGASFAKIGVATIEDPSFPSSVVPNKAQRIQFMVKDNKKYKSTDGWGYAIFDGNGKNLPQEAKNTPAACHACHKIVPDRDFVFAQPMEFQTLTVASIAQSIPPGKIKFEKEDVNNLRQNIRDQIPKKFLTVQKLNSSIQEKLFVGTINEVSPIMAKEVARTQSPTLLIQKEGLNFMLVLPDPDLSKCASLIPKRQPYLVIHNVNVDESNAINRSEFCQ